MPVVTARPGAITTARGMQAKSRAEAAEQAEEAARTAEAEAAALAAQAEDEAEAARRELEIEAATVDNVRRPPPVIRRWRTRLPRLKRSAARVLPLVAGGGGGRAV
eukprot:COSAG01_NODE_1838_length_9083_cov_3.184328_4_plen_106_part_00